MNPREVRLNTQREPLTVGEMRDAIIAGTWGSLSLAQAEQPKASAPANRRGQEQETTSLSSPDGTISHMAAPRLSTLSMPQDYGKIGSNRQRLGGGWSGAGKAEEEEEEEEEQEAGETPEKKRGGLGLGQGLQTRGSVMNVAQQLKLEAELNATAVEKLMEEERHKRTMRGLEASSKAKHKHESEEETSEETAKEQRRKTEMMGRLKEWCRELKYMAAHEKEKAKEREKLEEEVSEQRTVQSLKTQATFFREAVREVVGDNPEIASLLLEGWNMNTELLVGHYEYKMSATEMALQAKDREIEEMENRLEFIQTQMNERVLDHQLRSEAHQLHELRMSLRAKDAEIAQQQQAHCKELENADAQLISALARLHDATNGYLDDEPGDEKVSSTGEPEQISPHRVTAASPPPQEESKLPTLGPGSPTD